MIEQLLDDYGYYRTHTGHAHQMRSEGKRVLWPKMDKKKRAALQKMNDWCQRNGIDSRLWLYSLFKVRRWMFAPRWDQLVPSKKNEKKATARYHGLEEVALYQQRIQQQVHQERVAEGQVFDPNRDLSSTAEGYKRAYMDRGSMQQCMDESMTRTYGYHPKSLVCARCHLAKECEHRIQAYMPFDVTALRAGELTSEQAQAVVRGGHDK